MERIPTCSTLIRIFKAPKLPNGTVMSLDNTAPEQLVSSGVLKQAPVYSEGVYSKYFIIIKLTQIK